MVISSFMKSAADTDKALFREDRKIPKDHPDPPCTGEVLKRVILMKFYDFLENYGQRFRSRTLKIIGFQIL
jgi:hypothetical protein